MMARKQGTTVYRLNGHTLITTIIGNRRYFECPTMPDLVTFDGCEDTTAAYTEFERRACGVAEAAPRVSVEVLPFNPPCVVFTEVA